MMYITDAYFAKKIMEYMDRDRYSIDALEHILEFYDDRGETVEFDPVGICSEWTEYAPEEIDAAHKIYAVELRNGNFLTFDGDSC